MVTNVVEQCWGNFVDQATLPSVTTIDELRACHIAYVEGMMHRSFLTPRYSQVKLVVETIMQCIMQFCSIAVNNIAVAAGQDGPVPPECYAPLERTQKRFVSFGQNVWRMCVCVCVCRGR